MRTQLDRYAGRLARWLRTPGPPDTIFDLGLHTGEDTAFYLAKGFNVVAVEANPSMVRQAEQRFRRQIRSGRLVVLGVGVGDRHGTYPFYVNSRYSEWSSFDAQIGGREGGATVIEVPMIPFEVLVQRFGEPYYLKIDIEGGDFTALQRLALTAARPRYVSAENGSSAMVDLLVKLGYGGFKFINQAQVQQMRCPVPAREGRTVDWTFPWGASGPFGEDTPGAWSTAAQVLTAIRAIEQNPNHDPGVDGWFDLHARYGGA